MMSTSLPSSKVLAQCAIIVEHKTYWYENHVVAQKQTIGIKINHDLVFMINSSILQNTEVKCIGL